MNFTTLNLSTTLGQIAANAARGFDTLDTGAKAQVAAQTEQAVKAEIDRQMKIYLAEEKAYVDAVKKLVANMQRVHDLAVKDLAKLQKLKHKPSNAEEIKALHKRLDQSFMFCGSSGAELSKMAGDLTAHQDFRANPIPDALDAVVGAAVKKQLSDHFVKNRAPAIGWVGGLQGLKTSAEQVVKRTKLMQREAAVFASDAIDALKVQELIASEMDKLFKVPKGPLAIIESDYTGLADQINSNIATIEGHAKGKQTFPNRKVYDGFIGGQKFNVENFGGKIEGLRGVIATATARLNAIAALGKKAPLSPQQVARLKEAKTAIAEGAKLLKKIESAYSSFKKTIDKTLPKLKAPA
ncbi:MAG: hypothetical protein RQ752_08500 [Thermohalobaculum sp.]|nr:hypothetical protein [Thermohalobaculum sp.]